MRTVRHLRYLIPWKLRGRPVPPPHVVKQRAVRHYQERFGLNVFVETGTYLGEMVEAVRPYFREVYSIELGEELYARAREMFAAHRHVHLLQGDSGEVLPQVLQQVSEPCLFWLDGHFSGGDTAQGAEDYPILKELEQIGRHEVKNHVILIDDARLFVGSQTAPAKEQVFEGLKKICPAYTIEEKDDIIRAFVERG